MAHFTGFAWGRIWDECPALGEGQIIIVADYD